MADGSHTAFNLYSNTNLEHSIALSAPQTNRTLNTRANPGGPLARAQIKGLASVETWVEMLAGAEGDEQHEAGDGANAMEYD